MHRSQKAIAVDGPRLRGVVLQKGYTRVLLLGFLIFNCEAICNVYPRTCISLSASLVTKKRQILPVTERLLDFINIV